MNPLGEAADRRRLPWLDAALPGAGMILFGLFAHASFPFYGLSAYGLLITAAAVIRGLKRADRPLVSMGLVPVSSSMAGFAVLGAAYGLALYVVYCLGNGLEMRLPGLTGFALVSASIGTTEEVLFRGYIQGRLTRSGAIAAVTIAALLHTAYKTALFVWTPFPMEFNMPVFSAFTLAGGLGMGVLRQAAGNVYAPIAAHATFDILVYGDLCVAPWWVWSCSGTG